MVPIKFKKFLTKYQEIIIVILTYILLTTICFLINNFTKQISVYRDEFYYFELAKSFYNGQGMTMRGIPTNFQKILYPLFIAPCFGIVDPVIRIKIIVLFNCVMLCSSIFPIYLIAKQLNLNRKGIYVILLLSIVSPFYVYCITFMAENLYYPMVLWIIYFWLINKNKKNYIFSFLIGVGTYALYLCKENALFFLVIFCLYEFINPFIEYLNNKKSAHIIKEYFNTNKFLNMSLVLVGFFLCFTIFKLTLFKGMGAFYHQSSFDVINSFEKFVYLIYAFLYYLCGYGVMILFLPIIYPFFCYSKLNKNNKRLFLIMVLLILIAAANTAFAVSVREDYFESYKYSPRVILRYAAPSVICFLMININIFFNKKEFINENIQGRKRKVFTITLCTYLFIFILIFKGSPLNALGGTLLPSYYLSVFYLILNFANGLYASTSFILLMMLFNLFIAIIIFGINLLIYKKNSENYCNKISIGIFIISFVSSFAYLQNYYKKNYNASSEKLYKTALIDDFVFQNKDKNFLILLEKNSSDNTLFDTTLRYTSNCYYIDIYAFEKDIIELGIPSQIKVDMFLFKDTILNKVHDNPGTIDFIIKPNDLNFATLTLVNTNKLESLSNSYCSLYLNNNNYEFKFKRID